MSRREDEIIALSFLVGILAFFSLRERRIDTIKRNIGSTSTGDNIKKDWMKVGSDLKKSMSQCTPH